MGKMVCVTGASGYIASWLVKLLLHRGYIVKATVTNLSDPSKVGHLKELEGANERLQLYEANLVDEGSFDSAVDGCEGVFHTASPIFGSVSDPRAEMIDPAVKGTINVLKSCSKVSTIKRVVVTASSGSVNYNYDSMKHDVVVDETWFSDPIFCEENKIWYCLSKTLAETAAWKFAEENGLDLVTLHPGCTIGPMLQPTLNYTTEALLNLIKEVQESETIESLVKRLNSKKPSSAEQESAAKGVLQRLLPTHLSSFGFKIITKDACGGNGCFQISNYKRSNGESTEIMIKGTTAVDITSGLHWYLKYWCGAHVSWDKTGGVQLGSVPLPGSLPSVKDEGVTIQRPVPWNYYQNVVTSSYSYVWWDWERWEKEIDWMALQGINLPLAFTGQEAIWQKVFAEFNITRHHLNDFFGGPAFLAWARMGNLHGWGGPLTQNWLDKQLMLQKKILSRMIELGMTPVLPSFSGNVPAALKDIFPSANISRLGDWNTVNGDPRWCCTYLLDPSDPLFVEIGEAFMVQQIKEYGDITDIYSCDTFNENSPPTNDPSYISSLGSAVYKAMSKADKDAVWLMQGWLFYSDSSFWKPPQMKALLHSVPFGKMIVLDLFAEVKPIWKSSSQFYNTPYIWCMLHNFGGNIEMYGILDAVASGPIDARVSKNSTMIGVGMCMEGIEHNPVVYELMSEMAFRSDPLHLEEWLTMYSRRRYGKSVKKVEAAWKILHRTIYNCTDGIANHNTDYIVKFPDWDPSTNNQLGAPESVNMHGLVGLQPHGRFLLHETSFSLPQPHLWYNNQDAITALKLFLDSGNELAEISTYRYDLVDLARQCLSKLANEVYLNAISAFRRKDAVALTFQSGKFLQLIKDIDKLLAADDNFLLGTWLESAKNLSLNEDERKQYEWNARTQITMWYDNTKYNQSQLHDYANKFWSGLLERYYHPRALMYFTRLLESVKKNEAFKVVEWRKEWIAYSNIWQGGVEAYPLKKKGDALAIANDLYHKYFAYC